MCGWRVCDEGVYVCMRDEGELRCVCANGKAHKCVSLVDIHTASRYIFMYIGTPYISQRCSD